MLHIDLFKHGLCIVEAYLPIFHGIPSILYQLIPGHTFSISEYLPIFSYQDHIPKLRDCKFSLYAQNFPILGGTKSSVVSALCSFSVLVIYCQVRDTWYSMPNKYDLL